MFSTDKPLALGNGSMTLALNLPRVPFYVGQIHVPHGPLGIHCTFQAQGYTEAAINVTVSYDLKALSLKCDRFNFAIPSMRIEFYGGAVCHGVADNKRADVYKMVKSEVHGIVQKELKKLGLCGPTAAPVSFSECKGEAAAGPASLSLCALK